MYRYTQFIKCTRYWTLRRWKNESNLICTVDLSTIDPIILSISLNGLGSYTIDLFSTKPWCKLRQRYASAAFWAASKWGSSWSSTSSLPLLGLKRELRRRCLLWKAPLGPPRLRRLWLTKKKWRRHEWLSPHTVVWTSLRIRSIHRPRPSSHHQHW